MENQRMFEENPNPNAKIAFVMWTPFDFYVLKNIIKHLPEGEFVVCDTWYSPVENTGIDHINESINLLKENDIKWRVFLGLNDTKNTEGFFKKYDMVVAMHLWKPLAAWMFHEWNINKKSVLVNYGTGKDLVTAAPWSARFDIAVVEGSHTHKLLSPMVDSYIVGVPKYDDWFGGRLDRAKIDALKKYLDPSRKTILYLPTHGESSSLHLFSDALISLKNKYNLLIKLHHLNPVTEAGIVEKFINEKDIFLFGAKDDLLPLLFLADIVISDSSSASLEVLLVDKPLVVLDVPPRDTMDEYNGFWNMSNQYYDKSIEQQIKNPDNMIGAVVKTPEELPRGVEDAVLFKAQFVENRNTLKNYLFSYNDAKCGERAAETIRKFLHDEIKPETPVWGMAMRSYLSAKALDFKNLWDGKNNEISELKNKISVLEEKIKKYEN